MTEHDNDKGSVETEPHNQGNNEDARSVSVGFVVPDDGSGGKFISIKQEYDKKSVQNTERN